MKVSEAAKLNNMSEAEFRSLNNIPPRMLIKAGSALLVLRSLRVLEDVKANLADNGRLDLSPEAVAKRKKAARNGAKNSSKKSSKSTVKSATASSNQDKANSKKSKK